MVKTFTFILFGCFILCSSGHLWAQNFDRSQKIQQTLDSLSTDVPGLDQKVQLTVTGVPLPQYLFALSKASNLSISVDPKLNFTVIDSFNGVTAANILELLAKKYNLDVTAVGSIIYITPHEEPAIINKPLSKNFIVKYSQPNNTLSVELNNDSLGAVARKITQVSGKNIIVPAGLQTKLVSAFIQNALFDAALNKLAFGNQLKLEKTTDDFYIFQSLGENEELYVNGDNSTAVKSNFKPAGSGDHPVGGLSVVTLGGQKLISADISNGAIADLIRQASQQANINYSIYSEIKGTISIHVTNLPYSDFLSLLFKGSNYTFHSENGVYVIGDSNLDGLRAFKAIKLQNRSIDTVVAMIPAELKKEVEIKEFREQNTLLLSGSSAKIAEAESIITELDVLVPVVLIEVTMIDINKSRNVSTGISAGVADSVKTGGTILPGTNFTFSASSINNLLNGIGRITSINLGHVVPNFYVSLSALEATNNVEVRAVPKLTALNGHSATLSIGNSVYYKNSTQNYIPFAATSTSVLTNTYLESDANMDIAMKPIISGDDQITLSIKINISDFTSIPTDGSPPPKSTSKYETSLRVNNGDMILLGGIERTEKDDAISGFPILSRIPILKYIFSNKSRTVKKVVTIVFIKPTIMR